ncbi:unnamed protein product [Blepharisma stoltei]|uniref:PHD-type domain-containing protein n=1 Tax=Blepharisma stoltei TaxID=1481888 RepID=A0AAU9JI13_9CILI|nr:unnamed protein product [Blepharisma stoltei]
MAVVYPPGSSLTKLTSNQDNSLSNPSSSDAICQVCYGKNPNNLKKVEFAMPIHTCKTCDLTVHKACYGISPSAEAMFFCDRCIEVGPHVTVSCEICHQVNGALKKSGEKWVHVTCALFSRFTHIVDWLEMKPDAIRSSDADQFCNECNQIGHDTFKCDECEKRSHALCMLQKGTWNMSGLLQKRTEVYCEEHVEGNEEYCFCGKGYVEGAQYMICCDNCDTWYHGDCIGITAQVGDTIEQFVCKFCEQWNSTAKKLLKEDATDKKSNAKVSKQFVNFKLKDWLLLARIVFKRANKALEERSKIEDMEEVMEFAAKLPFEVAILSNLNAKLHNAKILIGRANSLLDKIHEYLEENEIKDIQEVITEARTIGVHIPHVTKEMPFLMKNEIKAIEDELKLAEDWDAKFLNIMKPIPPADLQVHLHEADGLSIKTPAMKTALEKWKDYSRWFSQSQSFLNPAEKNALPTIEQINEHICNGDLHISSYVDIADVKQSLHAKISQAENWHSQAAAAVSTKISQQLINQLINDAQSLICKFPELDLLEKRAHINQKINETLNKKHREEDLEILLKDAYEFDTDDELIQLVTFKIQSIKEIKERVHEALQGENNSSDLYLKLLEELKNEKTELLEEKQQIEDKIKSLQWIEQVNEIFDELDKSAEDVPAKKKKGNEIDTLKSLIGKAEKIIYKDAKTDGYLEELAFRLWELEFKRFDMCDEISLEQLQDLKIRASYLKTRQPESLIQFQSISKEVDESVAFFENLAQTDISEIFSGNVIELKQNLEFYKNKLENQGIIFPEKYNKFLAWDKWINWSLAAESLFFSSEKPSIDKLYDLNLEVIPLGISNEIPSVKKLTEEIANYENWLYRYTSYSSTRRAFSKPGLEVKNYLKLISEKPKLTNLQLQDLLQSARSLRTCCDQEILIMEQDLKRLELWTSKELIFAGRPYEELLIDCKKSYDEFIESEGCKEFYATIKEYFFENFIEHENFGIKLSSLEWNFRAQGILQQKGRILEEVWEEVYGVIEQLDKKILDESTLEKIKRLQQIKQQIEEEVRKIKNFVPQGEIKALTFEELDILYDKISTSKIILKDENFVKNLLEKTRNFSQRFNDMITNKASIEEFKAFQDDIEKHPISISEFSSKLKDILNKANNITLRMRILKENAGKNKMDKAKVEQFLLEYNNTEVKLEDADILIEELERGNQILAEGFEIVEKPDATMEELNSISGRLNNLHIHMGQEEKNLKIKIWKLRVTLSQGIKVSFPILQGWLNEGLQMKDPSLADSIEKLEGLVAKGEIYKERLAACSSLEEIQEIEKEAESLPFDLAHSFIEHKTRINLGGGKKESKSSETVPSKHSAQTDDPVPYNDPARMSQITAIEKTIIHDINYDWHKHMGKAKRYAVRLEDIIFKNHHGSKYRKTIDRMIRIIKRYQEFEGFSKKLSKGDITADELSVLNPKEAKEVKVIKRLFDGEPKICLTINKSKLTESDNPESGQPVKKPKLTPKQEVPQVSPQPAQIPKISPKPVSKEPPKPIATPAPLIKTTPKPPPPKPTPKPVSDFKVTNLISEIEANKKNQSKSLIVKNEISQPQLASEKYRAPQHLSDSSAVSRSTAADEEWRELSKFRLEHSGFTTTSGDKQIPQKRAPEAIDQLPPKRSKYERNQEGRFSSEEEEEEEDKEPSKKELETNKEKSEEYSVLELAKKNDYAKKHKKKGKLYDPFSVPAPKNKAPVGSLLKVWSGKLEYGKHFINVVMHSVDNIESFQKMPQLGSKISVQGRTKQDELEVYISQNASGSVSKLIATAWIEPTESNERDFSDLARDLTGKGRSAVIRIDNSLTIYLTSLNESFQSFLSSVRININRKIDETVVPHISTKEKLGCILFFKKTAMSSSSYINPDVIVKIEPASMPEIDDLPEKEQEMSPITDEEENPNSSNDQLPKALQDILLELKKNPGDQSQILNNLQQAISTMNPQELAPNNSEINDLISAIKEQVKQESQQKQQPAVQNVNQFLSQNFQLPPQRQQPGYMYMPQQNYMYPPQPIYPPGQYYQGQPPPQPPAQYYRPPSPERKHDDPRRQNRY